MIVPFVYSPNGLNLLYRYLVPFGKNTPQRKLEKGHKRSGINRSCVHYAHVARKVLVLSITTRTKRYFIESSARAAQRMGARIKTPRDGFNWAIVKKTSAKNADSRANTLSNLTSCL
jgi:hypothetical protein